MSDMVLAALRSHVPLQPTSQGGSCLQRHGCGDPAHVQAGGGGCRGGGPPRKAKQCAGCCLLLHIVPCPGNTCTSDDDDDVDDDVDVCVGASYRTCAVKRPLRSVASCGFALTAASYRGGSASVHPMALQTLHSVCSTWLSVGCCCRTSSSSCQQVVSVANCD